MATEGNRLGGTDFDTKMLTADEIIALLEGKQDLIQPYMQDPLMDGTASYGNISTYAAGNHRHPTDTSRQGQLVAQQVGGGKVRTVVAQILNNGSLTSVELATKDFVPDGSQYVLKAGDTMTGGLTVPDLTVGSRADGSDVGENSVAEGVGNTASGIASHAEGGYATASGNASHAEGASTTASGNSSHAEGEGTKAIGGASHVEGSRATASGFVSHAEGDRTIAQNRAEHAQGLFNVSHTGDTDAEKTIHSIGIGTINSRANAVEVMRDGKVFVYGLGGYDGTNPTGSGVKDLVTAIGSGGGGQPDRIVSPNGGTVVSAVDGGTATISSTSIGNPRVTLPEGFSVVVSDKAYTAPAGGETIEFIGPYQIELSPGAFVTLWIPSSYADDPQSFSPYEDGGQWFMECYPDTTSPVYLGFYLIEEGSVYLVSNFNSLNPTLRLDPDVYHSGQYADGGPAAITRESIGVKTLATTDQIPVAPSLPISVANGGTGATTAAAARANLGAVNRSGDTMTGGLTVPNLTVGLGRASGSTVGENSVAAGEGPTASGFNSHAEGIYATASGEGAHAEGCETVAQNSYEHAQGQYNASHAGLTAEDETIHSIGVGTSRNARANAVEVMRDGKVFVKGVGGYDGTNPDTATDLATTINGKVDVVDRIVSPNGKTEVVANQDGTASIIDNEGQKGLAVPEGFSFGGTTPIESGIVAFTGPYEIDGHWYWLPEGVDPATFNPASNVEIHVVLGGNTADEPIYVIVGMLPAYSISGWNTDSTTLTRTQSFPYTPSDITVAMVPSEKTVATVDQIPSDIVSRQELNAAVSELEDELYEKVSQGDWKMAIGSNGTVTVSGCRYKSSTSTDSTFSGTYCVVETEKNFYENPNGQGRIDFRIFNSSDDSLLYHARKSGNSWTVLANELSDTASGFVPDSGTINFIFVETQNELTLHVRVANSSYSTEPWAGFPSWSATKTKTVAIEGSVHSITSQNGSTIVTSNNDGTVTISGGTATIDGNDLASGTTFKGEFGPFDSGGHTYFVPTSSSDPTDASEAESGWFIMDGTAIGYSGTTLGSISNFGTNPTITWDNGVDVSAPVSLSWVVPETVPHVVLTAYVTGTVATEGYVDDKIGDINSVLDAINGEVI